MSVEKISQFTAVGTVAASTQYDTVAPGNNSLTSHNPSRLMFAEGSVKDIIGGLPASPADGDRYLVAMTGTSGVLVGKEGCIAVFYAAAGWQYSLQPASRASLWVDALANFVYWDGTTWAAGPGIINADASVTPQMLTTSVGASLTGIPESGVTNLTADLALKAPLASPTFTGVAGFASGTAVGPSISMSGTGLYRLADGSLGVSIGGADRFVVGPTGYIGIGNSAPLSPLDIKSSTRLYTRNSAPGDGTVYMDQWFVALPSNDYWTFQYLVANSEFRLMSAQTNGTVLNSPIRVEMGTNDNAIYVDAAGKVGFGKTTPGTQIDVAGTVTATEFSGSGAGLTGIPESGVTNLTADLALKAPLASPTFTGTITGNGGGISGIPEGGVTNLTADLALKAPLANPMFTGTITGDGSGISGIPESGVTNLTTDLGLKAPLASPAFTGVVLVADGAVAGPALAFSAAVGTGFYRQVGGSVAITIGGSDRMTVSPTGTVTATEFSGSGAGLTGIPESGVTNLTADLALKAPLASPTFTGTITGNGGGISGIPEGGVTNLTADLAAKLPSASYTAADVLTKIKTVDGSGSGLDADTLDGQQGAYYLAATSYTAADVLTKIKTVDGSGSGLDADTLDGISSASFLRSDATDSFTTLSGSTLYCGYNPGTANSIGCSNWFSSNGSTGWKNDSYGGGWYQIDTTWMRSYNNKGIYTSGTIEGGAVTATSDRRLKSDLRAISDASDLICSTTVYRGKKLGKEGFFVIAQEAREVVPEIVHEGGGMFGDDPDPLLTVDYSGYVPILIQALKDANTRIAALEAMLAQ